MFRFIRLITRSSLRRSLISFAGQMQILKAIASKFKLLKALQAVKHAERKLPLQQNFAAFAAPLLLKKRLQMQMCASTAARRLRRE